MFPTAGVCCCLGNVDAGENSALLCISFYQLVTAPHSHVLLSLQGVPEGNANILGGHSIGNSKQKKKVFYIYTCVLFRTVSDMELFHCTVPKLLIRRRYFICMSNTTIYQLTHISLCIIEFFGRTVSLRVSAHGAIFRRYINKPYTIELCILYGSIYCIHHCVLTII
jgi:hypothetical protein